MMGGEYCAIWLGPEMPGDQRRDDALSVCYDTVLDNPIDIVGAPEIKLTLSSDKPVAMVAVRLCDVHPDGASTRITYGVFNLCHRNGHDRPEPLVPGEAIGIRFKLDDIAYRMPAGHILRVAVSSSYWPMVWPSPENVSLTIEGGQISVPSREPATGDEWSFPEPEAASPWQLETLRTGGNSRSIEHDQVTGKISLVIEDDFGEARDKDHGLIHGGVARERWEINARRSAFRLWRDPLDRSFGARQLAHPHRDIHDDAVGQAQFLSDRAHRSIRKRQCSVRARFYRDDCTQSHLTLNAASAALS